MASLRLTDISMSDVYAIKTWFMNTHADLLEGRSNDRKAVLDQINILARTCDLFVQSAKSRGVTKPRDALVKVLKDHPAFLAKQLRTPAEEVPLLLEWYGLLPEDTRRQFECPEGDGEDGVPFQGNDTPNSQNGNGEGNGDTQDGEGDEDSQGGDSQNGEGDEDGEGDSDSQDGEGSDNPDGPEGEEEQGISIENPHGPGISEPHDEEDQEQEQDQEPPDEDTTEGKIYKAMGYTFIKKKTKRGFINIIGDAGLGKTYLTRKCSDRYKAEYFIQTAVDTVSELIGTMTLKEVNGASVTEFVPSNLVKALMFARDHPDRRVVLVLDEYDCLPNPVKTKLNSLLAPPYVLSIKGGTIGDIQMGPNVVVVAISNTAGHGGDEVYPDREMADGSTMDRFFFNIVARFEHDTAVEIAEGDEGLVGFIEDYNKSIEKAGALRFRASYRTIEAAIANKDAGFSKEEFMPTLTKMATEQEVAQLYEGLMNKRTGWAQSLKVYLQSLSGAPEVSEGVIE